MIFSMREEGGSSNMGAMNVHIRQRNLSRDATSTKRGKYDLQWWLY